MWMAIIFFIVLGLIYIINPKFSWYLGKWADFFNLSGTYTGRLFDKSKPDQRTLRIYRLVGIGYLIIAFLFYMYFKFIK